MSQLTKYLNYLHCKLGDAYPMTWRGNWFYFSIQDGATWACYTKPVRTKDQAFEIFQKFICQAKRQSGRKPKHLRTNFAGEFINQAFEEYTGKEDIKWEPSALYIPK